MTRTFVALDDPVHHLLREITRSTSLRAAGRTPGAPQVEYEVRAGDLPEAYFALVVFHALQGLTLAQARSARWSIPGDARAGLPELVSYFDSVRLDLRCCRDMRLKAAAEGPGMVSAELLSFGTGMLRARNDDPTERIHRHIWSQYGRLYSRHEVVYARIRALHRNSFPAPEQTGKEGFDSTNLIFGDAFGELEQLWERRADTAFLDQVAQSLPQAGTGELATFCHPPLAPDSIMELHFRAQAIWKAPPANGRALLRRLDYILGNTTIDNNPQTVYQWRPQTRSQTGVQRSRSPWSPDASGYDGWLADDGGN